MRSSYEKKKNKEGFRYIIGCDEAGRGSLAGPVVAAAVVLQFPATNDKLKAKSFKAIKDSKLLTPQKREELSVVIKKYALAWAVAGVNNKIIDKINIHRASLLAMSRVIKKLLNQVAFATEQIYVSVDGKFEIPKLIVSQEAIIGGDNKILSIAAASILAKVHRDQLMRSIHPKYPVYNFFQHKGYGTFYHRKMILKYNLCPIHRMSFCKKITANPPS